MLKKLFEFKSSVNFLLAVGLMVGLILASSDIYNALVFKPKTDRIPFEIPKLILFDLGVAGIFTLVICIPYLALVRLSTFLGDLVLVIFCLIFILINTALNQYYATTHVPLGNDLYGYTFEEIQVILNSSTSFNINEYLTFLSFPIAFLILVYLIKYFGVKARYLISPMLIGFAFFVLSSFIDSNPLNNLAFFVSESIDYKGNKSKVTKKEIWNEENKYPLLKPQKFDFNLLGDYLNLKDTKPNIMVIVMEGMGRDFMGDNAQYKGFTPYLDSLSKQSLYWDNFVSNAGRSFGALPSILGSAPFGQQGFLELEEIPDHLSFISLLRQNNYKTSYFEGGDSDFDKKLNYLNNEGMENIVDMHNYGKGYVKTKSNDGGFSWGYPDTEIYKKSLTLLEPSSQPRLDILLTISNHEPFLIPDQEKYRKLVPEIAKKNNYDSDQLEITEDYTDIFATLKYTDDALRGFMNAYKSHPNYENTIFIITGDHRLIPVPQKDAICRYHVPLIIHSSMQKKAQVFKGISSHMDIMPTIMAMLKINFNAKLPDHIPFVGQGLSGNLTFGKNTSEIPVMRHKGTFKDIISGDYFLNGSSLFKISDNLKLTESYDGAELKKITAKYDRFNKVNNYVTSQNMIMPKNMAINSNKASNLSAEDKKRIEELTKSESNNEIFKQAKKLAFNKKREDAILLCKYILKRSPGNVDTRTLKGRIHSWDGNVKLAEEEFMYVINRNPTYQDSYRAAITMFWWHSEAKKAKNVAETARKNCSDDKEFMKEIDTLMAKFKK